MPKDFAYNRLKSSTVNSTDINFTIKAAEVGESLGADLTGSTGALQAQFSADADESVGADVQVIGKFTITPVLGASHPGSLAFLVSFTPVDGGASDLTAQTYTFNHPQSMDAWQTEAGRARQA